MWNIINNEKIISIVVVDKSFVTLTKNLLSKFVDINKRHDKARKQSICLIEQDYVSDEKMICC
jgi:hypothetical protein